MNNQKYNDKAVNGSRAQDRAAASAGRFSPPLLGEAGRYQASGGPVRSHAHQVVLEPNVPGEPLGLLMETPAAGAGVSGSPREAIDSSLVAEPKRDIQKRSAIMETPKRDSTREKRIEEGFWSPSYLHNSRKSRNKNMKRLEITETKTHNRFYVLESTEKDKTMHDVSEFILDREITEKCMGEPESCSILYNGTMLIKSRNTTQSEKIERIEHLNGMKVKVKPHERLNTSKGTVLAQKWDMHTTEELVGFLNKDGVIDVKKLRSRPDKKFKGERYLLTFNRMTPPEKIKGGLRMLEVREFIPSPRRCYNCQGFGHMGTHCRRTQAVCVKCASYVHVGRDESCTHRTQCINCRGEHSASDRECPIYQKEKEIITIVTKEKISFREARKRVKRGFPDQRTFAQVVREDRRAPRRVQELPTPLIHQKEKQEKIPERQKRKHSTDSQEESGEGERLDSQKQARDERREREVIDAQQPQVPQTTINEDIEMTEESEMEKRHAEVDLEKPNLNKEARDDNTTRNMRAPGKDKREKNEKYSKTIYAKRVQKLDIKDMNSGTKEERKDRRTKSQEELKLKYKTGLVASQDQPKTAIRNVRPKPLEKAKLNRKDENLLDREMRDEHTTNKSLIKDYPMPPGHEQKDQEINIEQIKKKQNEEREDYAIRVHLTERKEIPEIRDPRINRRQEE